MKISLLLNRYGVWGAIRLFRDVLYTKIFYKNTRIVRLPIYIRGKREIDFGEKLTVGVGLRLDAFGYTNNMKNKKLISFGKGVQINDYVHIAAIDKVEIGDNVLIASKVFITDHNHGSYTKSPIDTPNSIPSERQLFSSPVIIKENVWIGEGVCILPGVEIGEGAIIGTMSVVTKNIPPNTIAVGSPAKAIKEFNFEKGIWEQIRK